jgi:hypothetical protein
MTDEEFQAFARQAAQAFARQPKGKTVLVDRKTLCALLLRAQGVTPTADE